MEMKNINLPLIALRGMTVLPDMVIHFDISRKKSIHAVEKAMEKDQKIFLATQVDPEVSDPEYEDLYHVGTLVKIKQLIKLPNSVVRVLVEGVKKGTLEGVTQADGMFPIDIETKDYNQTMIKTFDNLIKDKKFGWKLENILPKVLIAGDKAGILSEEGAKLLDPSGNLEAGIPLCPPEGDAGTGMVATNSVTRKTGNVSAGTSVFAMIVLEKELKKVYDEIDLVTTPSGDLVGMVHCNNCTSDLNAWVNLFKEFAQNFGVEDVDMDQLYGTLYNKALEGDKDCGGLLAYNYFSGEHITGFEEGRPLFVRKPDSNFNLANFMRVHLYTALGALKTGLDILMKEEDVKVDKMLGHGGLFKTEGVGQKIMAAAVNAPVSVMKTAGEGGAWGMAILAAYMLDKAEDEMLDTYLSDKVFAGEEGTTIAPDEKDVEGFDEFIKQYQKGLALERVAIDVM